MAAPIIFSVSSSPMVPPLCALCPLWLILLCHCVSHFDLASDDVASRLFDLIDHQSRDQMSVVFVNRVADAVILQAVNMHPALEFSLDLVLDDAVNGVVDPFEHAGQDVAGFDPVLVCVDPDGEFVVSLGGVEDA